MQETEVRERVGLTQPVGAASGRFALPVLQG